MIYTQNPNAATSTEEMQQIARNQIQAKIDELQERINALDTLLNQVESVVDYATYAKATKDIADYDDKKDLTALDLLGNYYLTMKEEGYF